MLRIDKDKNAVEVFVLGKDIVVICLQTLKEECIPLVNHMFVVG